MTVWCKHRTASSPHAALLGISMSQCGQFPPHTRSIDQVAPPPHHHQHRTHRSRGFLLSPHPMLEVAHESYTQHMMRWPIASVRASLAVHTVGHRFSESTILRLVRQGAVVQAGLVDMHQCRGSQPLVTPSCHTQHTYPWQLAVSRQVPRTMFNRSQEFSYLYNKSESTTTITTTKVIMHTHTHTYSNHSSHFSNHPCSHHKGTDIRAKYGQNRHQDENDRIHVCPPYGPLPVRTWPFLRWLGCLVALEKFSKFDFF